MKTAEDSEHAEQTADSSFAGDFCSLTFTGLKSSKKQIRLGDVSVACGNGCQNLRSRVHVLYLLHTAPCFCQRLRVADHSGGSGRAAYLANRPVSEPRASAGFGDQ